MEFSWLEFTSGLIVLSILILWCTSHILRYYGKLLLYSMLMMLSAVMFIPIFIWRPRNIQNMGILINWFRKTLWVFGVKWEIRNLSNLVYDKPCVIICNHQSIIDIIGMLEILPLRTTVIAKKELMFAGPFGLASWLAGVIFVDRGNRGKSHETMAYAAKIMHDNNIKVWIFPEGTRNSGNHLLPFKKGAFYLAVQAQVPIFPVVFSSYQDFLSDEVKIFNSGKVIVTCLPRIDTTGLTTDTISALTDRLHSSMENVFKTTSVEAHQQALHSGKLIVCSTIAQEVAVEHATKKIKI